MPEEVVAAGRALHHLLIGGLLGLICCVMLGLLFGAGLVTALVVGAAVLPEAMLVVRRLAGFERRRTARWSGQRVPEAYAPLTGGLVDRLRALAKDPATFRDARWLVAQLLYGVLLMNAALVLLPFCALVDGVWCVLLRRPALLLPLLGRLADLEAGISRTLLLPPPGVQLAERVEELTVTRAGAVAAHGAELRRIERDLHDGAQARIVALSMRLGLARRAYDHDPETARRFLDEAQTQAEEALAELRHVVRGIHPPVLTDRGLAGAVRALAASSGLAVEVITDGLADGPHGPRAPAAVEAAAYFVIAEALTNVAKHSGADHAFVGLVREPTRLRVTVRDTGRGGADTAGGSGLLGIRRRVAALDGGVTLTSPAGGPTSIEVELPCAW